MSVFFPVFFFLFFILCVYCARQRCWSLYFSSNFQWMTFFCIQFYVYFAWMFDIIIGRKPKFVAAGQHLFYLSVVWFHSHLVTQFYAHSCIPNTQTLSNSAFLFFCAKIPNITDKKRMKRTAERTRPNRFVIFHFY